MHVLQSGQHHQQLATHAADAANALVCLAFPSIDIIMNTCVILWSMWQSELDDTVVI
jgi:hypothetical protein